MSNSLTHLREELALLETNLASPVIETGEQARQRLIRRLDDHLIPRSQSLGAPLLAVFGGSTGSGKSTLINSLLGVEVSASSAVRPTTRRPVLVHNEVDASWFSSQTILPTLSRVHSRPGVVSAPESAGIATHQSIELRGSAQVPEGLGLIDAPDFDSISGENRVLSRQLLDGADLWIFVTTAARYADAVAWEILHRAIDRGIEIAVVLNRVPSDAVAEVSADLRRLLSEAGLGEAPVFTVEESDLPYGFLPATVVAPLWDWLRSRAFDSETRTRVATAALHGSLKDALTSVDTVVRGVEEHERLHRFIASSVSSAKQTLATSIDEVTADGSLLRGEVLARWQDLVGAANISRFLSRGFATLRDRASAWLKGREIPAAPVGDAMEAGLSSLLSETLLKAYDQVQRMLSSEVALSDIAERIAAVDSRDVQADAKNIVHQWQNFVVDLVREQGASKRSTARIAATSVNVLSVALMIAVFVSTAGVTGTELGIAGTSALLAQKLLETIFGDQAMRAMAKAAKGHLQELLAGSIDSHYEGLLAAVPQAPAVTGLLEARTEVYKDWELQ